MSLATRSDALLAASSLPTRWQGRERFVVLQTRFGAGHDFFDTWHAWRQDAARCERLVFVSLDGQPLSRGDLSRAHAASLWPDLTAQLIASWPPLTPGMHTLRFEGGRVELLLALGHTRSLLRELVLQADAFFLDADTPWDRHALKSLARLAAPRATAAHPGGVATLGDDLRAAGFASAADGARFAPRHQVQRPAGREAIAPGARHAVIVGAGLAGAACALALSRQGVACTVVDALPGPAQASSGNPAGLFHGTVNPDDGPHARFNRAAALATQQLLAELALPHQRGLLRLETRLAVDAMPSAPGYVEPQSAAQASAMAGAPLAHPAWFYPGGGALDPAAYVRAMLAASAATLQLDTAVASLRENDDGWALLDAAGAVIAQAPLVVLAGGHAQLPVLGGLGDDLTVQRGQLTHLPDAPWCPAVPVAGDGYVIADGRGGVWCGATGQDGDADPTLRATDQADNLTRYARLAGLEEPPPAWTHAPLAGRVAWRLLAPDRLPLIGGLATPGEPAAQLRQQARRPGLVVCTAFGSRGIGWAALAGQLVAALALGAPRPLEAELLDAIDPLRFALRRQRRAGA